MQPSSGQWIQCVHIEGVGATKELPGHVNIFAKTNEQ